MPLAVVSIQDADLPRSIKRRLTTAAFAPGAGSRGQKRNSCEGKQNKVPLPARLHELESVLTPVVERAMRQRDERDALRLKPKERQKETGAKDSYRLYQAQGEGSHILDMLDAGKLKRNMPQRSDRGARDGRAAQSPALRQARKHKGAPSYFLEESKK